MVAASALSLRRRGQVNRAKQGAKRSNLVDANGIPLAVIPAPDNSNDSPLLGPTLRRLIREGWKR